MNHSRWNETTFFFMHKNKKEMHVLSIISFLVVFLSILAWLANRHSRAGESEFYATAKLLGRPAPNVFQHAHLIHLGKAVDPSQILPRYFKYKERLLTPMRTQGQCASCWAFSVADVIADRVSLHTRGKIRENLSVQELVSCYKPQTFRCETGGLPESAFTYVVSKGLVSESKYPYDQLDGGPNKPCLLENFSFWDSWNIDPSRHEKQPHRVFAKQGSIKELCYPPLTQSLIDRNIVNMKSEILLNGPIVGTVYIYDDLYSYDAESVYQVSKGARLIGGHAIEVFGWSDAGQNTEERGFEGGYWICRNSWGGKWPRNLAERHGGYFYVAMGTNEAGIESRASAAEPLLTQAMLDMGKESTWSSTAYLSYDSYVNDPERQQFFNHLARRRRT